MPSFPPEPFRIKIVEPIQLIPHKEGEAMLKDADYNAFGLRVGIAFAPIDHENTLMYIRYYHNLRLPLLRQLYAG